jgi:hypothetical protein
MVAKVEGARRAITWKCCSLGTADALEGKFIPR